MSLNSIGGVSLEHAVWLMTSAIPCMDASAGVPQQSHVTILAVIDAALQQSVILATHDICKQNSDRCMSKANCTWSS